MKKEKGHMLACSFVPDKYAIVTDNPAYKNHPIMHIHIFAKFQKHVICKICQYMYIHVVIDTMADILIHSMHYYMLAVTLINNFWMCNPEWDVGSVGSAWCRFSSRWSEKITPTGTRGHRFWCWLLSVSTEYDEWEPYYCVS